jgi:hypothetical protein
MLFAPADRRSSPPQRERQRERRRCAESAARAARRAALKTYRKSAQIRSVVRRQRWQPSADRAGCRIEPYIGQGGAATRHRWPGVSAGLCLGEARPAHAGPHPSHTADQAGSIVAAAGGGSRLSRSRLSSSRAAASMAALRAIACDRLRRPLTRRPLPRTLAPTRKMARTSSLSHCFG